MIVWFLWAVALLVLWYVLPIVLLVLVPVLIWAVHAHLRLQRLLRERQVPKTTADLEARYRDAEWVQAEVCDFKDVQPRRESCHSRPRSGR